MHNASIVLVKKALQALVGSIKIMRIFFFFCWYRNLLPPEKRILWKIGDDSADYFCYKSKVKYKDLKLNTFKDLIEQTIQFKKKPDSLCE